MEPKCIAHATDLAEIKTDMKYMREDIQELKAMHKEALEFKGKMKVIGVLLGTAWAAIIGLFLK